MIFAKWHRDTALGKRALICAVFLISLLGVQNAQKANPQKTNGEKAQELTRLINSKYTFEDLLRGNPEAVSLDEQIFTLTSDAKVKRRIASILITLGIKDPVYFNYLVQEAKKGLDNEMPWPSAYDEHGRLNKDITPAFIAWCKEQGIDPNDPHYASYRAADPAWLQWCMKRHLNLNNSRYAAYYEIPDGWVRSGGSTGSSRLQPAHSGAFTQPDDCCHSGKGPGQASGPQGD